MHDPAGRVSPRLAQLVRRIVIETLGTEVRVSLNVPQDPETLLSWIAFGGG